MSLISEIRSAAEMIQKADNIELYRKILDLQYEAMSLMEKYNAAIEENNALKERIETAGKMKFINNMYYIEKEGDPYCSKCWDVDNKRVRLHGNSEGFFQCPSCKTVAYNERGNETYNSSGAAEYVQW
jgi:hypothetical protein